MLLLMFFLQSFSFASYISLNTTTTVSFENNMLLVNVRSQNKGDESAHNVQAEFFFMGKRTISEKKQELKVNEKIVYDAPIRTGVLSPGQYPVILILHYTDANQYPFSALSAQTVNINSPSVISDVFGKSHSASFWKEGEFKVDLKNMSDIPIKAKTTLFAPRELDTQNNPQETIINGKAEVSLSYKVRNFSALSGSSYQVVAISEYDSNDAHKTAITPGTVIISETRTIAGIGTNTLMLVLISLAIIFLSLQWLPFFKSEKK